MTAQDADGSEPTGPDEEVEFESEADESQAVQEGTGTPEAVESFLSALASASDDDLEETLLECLADSPAAGEEMEGSDDAEPNDEESADPVAITIDDELVDELAEVETEHLARALGALRVEVARLETRLAGEAERADDLESRLARKQADFQNYKKRQQKRHEEEKQRATEDLVARLLDVRDNLERALEQDDDTDIRGGVESTLEQFDHQLERENVARIEPTVGGDTDPRRHEVLVTIASDEPEGSIAQVHRPGYEMAGKVLRPAQVAVSDGSLADDADAETADEDAADGTEAGEKADPGEETDARRGGDE